MPCPKHPSLLALFLLSLVCTTQAQVNTEPALKTLPKKVSLTSYSIVFIYNSLKHATAEQATTTNRQPAKLLPTNSWQAKLYSHLATFKCYPKEAKQLKQEGTAVVNFVLDENGKVLTAEVTRSSGVASLDTATIAMIQRASPMPKPPAKLLDKDGKLLATIPISYTLNKSKPKEN